MRSLSHSLGVCLLPHHDPLQALTPQMTENKRRAEELLREAYTLRACLQDGAAPGVLEKLLPKRYKQWQKGVGSSKA